MPVRAQEPMPAGWSIVMQVPTGERIRVRLKDGREVLGNAAQVSTTELVVTVRKQPIQIAPREVRTIHDVVGRSRLRAAFIAGAIGTAVGALLGGSSRSESAASGAFSFGSVGAAFGAIGSSGQREILIFQTN